MLQDNQSTIDVLYNKNLVRKKQSRNWNENTVSESVTVQIL